MFYEARSVDRQAYVATHPYMYVTILTTLFPENAGLTNAVSLWHWTLATTPLSDIWKTMMTAYLALLLVRSRALYEESLSFIANIGIM